MQNDFWTQVLSDLVKRNKTVEFFFKVNDMGEFPLNKYNIRLKVMFLITLTHQLFEVYAPSDHIKIKIDIR